MNQIRSLGDVIEERKIVQNVLRIFRSFVIICRPLQWLNIQSFMQGPSISSYHITSYVILLAKEKSQWSLLTPMTKQLIFLPRPDKREIWEVQYVENYKSRAEGRLPMGASKKSVVDKYFALKTLLRSNPRSPTLFRQEMLKHTITDSIMGTCSL